jgi:peptide/nickel transport system permease protein
MAQYIFKRLVVMLVTVFLISIVSFIIIQLPPGDWATNYLTNLQAQGVNLRPEELEAVRERYGLDQPVYVQYAAWMRNILLYGDWGQSFTMRRPVKEVIWERLALTIALSGFAIIFSWIVSILLGVYSATHQYSIGDYICNLLSFIGAGTPDFMLALMVMWIAYSSFGLSVGGLNSQEYIREPWSWPKLLDLAQHMVVPVIVLAVGNTAWLMRTTRGNLLDEMNKSYVETARAKGLKESKLIWKYPVRVALNPFFSIMGWSLSTLISGTTLVSIVLNLDTTGPILLKALMDEDMYLAGSLLMLLSVLSVLGSLISDIILAIVDPRIRLQG